MSELEELIKNKYNNKLSESECREASNNIVGFFEVLYKINARLEQEKKLKEQQSNNNVKAVYEDNRSTN